METNLNRRQYEHNTTCIKFRPINAELVCSEERTETVVLPTHVEATLLDTQMTHIYCFQICVGSCKQ
jgi:hypothetical protein